MDPFESDNDYLEFIKKNPESYILTSSRSLTDRHTKIHRADCIYITRLTGNAKPGGFTRDYIKVPASQKEILVGWLKDQKADAKYALCTKCAP